MSSKRPLIGINTGVERDADGTVYGMRPLYWEAVVRVGGVPLLMPPLADAAMVDAVLDRVGAFLMVGGDDISPGRLGVDGPAPNSIVMDPRREESDFLLIERLLARRMPTLAICLGCQELNVARGGTIYLDLDRDGPPDLASHRPRAGETSASHPIAIAEGSTLSRLWDGAREAVVVSSHHQAIRELGAGLRPLAWAPDGVVEAVEVADRPFFLGVQWHPERQAERDPLQRKLFAALVHHAIK